jgi:putative PIN family toxin of toxin-antitoxin system
MQRAVIDTNTWVSGLVWRGAPHLLTQQILQGRLRCVTSPELLLEFERVLAYPRLEKALRLRGLAAAELARQLRLVCDVISAPPLSVPVCRDPDDDALLACASAAQADLIVSGDDDLLTLVQYRDIPILTASQANVWLGGVTDS